MVLGRKSLSISEPFSRDLETKTKFQFLKLTKKLQEKPENPEEPESEFFEVRVKTGEWSYKMVKRKRDEKSDTKREGELDVRSKYKSDKFC